MNQTIRQILAPIIGIAMGSIINMGIIMLSGFIIPPPAGADLTNMESLKASMHLFLPKHFIFPFLAHALGTFVGALLTALIAVNYKMRFALLIGLFFMAGGIINIFMLPAPIWFNLIDLLFAYIPMAYLGGLWARKF